MIEKKVDLKIPDGSKKILMHSCCAPCSGELIEQVIANGIELTIFFYNPNIHPVKEYNIRKDENIRYAREHNIEFIDADYDVQDWFERVKGLEHEPERGERCTKCFDRRFDVTALYAYENGFSYFTSSLGLSRWKDMDQINMCGHRSASRYEGVSYWDYNWRKHGGAERMYKISKREKFYKQEYCGCIYSLRDTNLWREKNNRPKIEIGKEYYTE